MNLVPYGIYKVKDQYFRDFPSPNDRYVHNKSENRPYYLAIQDQNGIIWLLPMSTQVEKYRAKIAADECKYDECITCFLMPYMSGERAVLIGNMIPVTEEYIKGEFTIARQHYVVKNQRVIREIKKRASKYLTLVRQGRMKPCVDILAIEQELIRRSCQISENAAVQAEDSDHQLPN